MTNEEKAIVLKLIHDGHIQKAIDGLLVIKRTKSLDKAASAIAARYGSLKQKENAGTIPFEQLKTTENEIVNHLIELIKHPEDRPFSKNTSIHSPTNTHNSGYAKWIYGAVAIVTVMLVILETANIIDIIPSNEPLQLTVFVTDSKGNVVLELEGELNIPLGNRSLREIIGANGRTNFPDITSNNIGDTIRIGLKANGWEIDGKKTFVFTGDPITLIVRRDNSLGIVRGRVTNHNGKELIEGAKVVIKDIAVYTDANGYFSIVLPEDMRVEEATERYKLIVSKEGYITKTQYHHPNSSDAEIRLEKEKHN